MAAALSGGVAHIQDGAPRSWEPLTGGGEAAWVGPPIAGSWGYLAGYPLARLEGLPWARAMAAENSKQFWKRSAKLPGR